MMPEGRSFLKRIFSMMRDISDDRDLKGFLRFI